MQRYFEAIPNEAKQTLEVPDIPGTMNFWHGGNLDEYNDIIAQKNGRYEYGAGLYLTTHYDTALKYAKGSRKLYLITVQEGQDINTAKLPTAEVQEFIRTYVGAAKRKELIQRIQEYDNEGQVKAYLFNNMCISHKAIKPSYTKILREFLINSWN